MQMKQVRIMVLASTLSTAVLACSSPYTISTDPVVNYERVFVGVPLNDTAIVNSRLEILHRRFLRMIPMSDGNGEWEFEFLADPSWVALVRAGFEETAWPELSAAREVPSWFSPTAAAYSVWRQQPTSYPTVHLFIERTPIDPRRIHVFIRRH